MRTVSAKHPKGQEPERGVIDDLKLLAYIVRTGLHYLVAGRPIRRAWLARQRAREKYYLDED